MAGINLREQSMDLTVKVLKLCEGVSAHRSLVIRLEQAVTDIGANIHEASYIYGTEQVSCLQAAMKYCYETEYWLELFVNTEMVDKDEAKTLYYLCGALRNTLAAHIASAKDF
jgi:four helix bundle protein